MRFLDEVDEIACAIPDRDLAIQWDVCLEMIEFATISNRSEAMRQLFGSGIPNDELLSATAHVSDHVPADVELGLHLCYGLQKELGPLNSRETAYMVRRAVNWGVQR